MITLQDVSKSFGDNKAVDHVSLAVESGENLVLLGTSGCGKTTTLKMINRLIDADEGEITVDGQPVNQYQPETLRRSIGYVMQHHGLFPHYTVRENIGIVPSLLKWPSDKIADRVSVLADKLRLPQNLLGQFPASLSGGQQQRVGLARALAADPPILLMDEPFGALDNLTRRAIRNEFLHLEELRQKTVVMVTHDVEEAFEMGNRIALMDKGKIVQIGSPGELLLEPADDFVREFMQGQQLMLELRSVDILKIFPYLRNEAVKDELLPYGNFSLWHILENPDKYTAKDNHTLPAIMAAYQQYKSQGRYE